MSKHDEANLILKLYELRREPVMRQARDWYFMSFNPQSLADLQAVFFSEHSGHLRMVLSYWDMAAALVNSGAIDLDLFTETNGEHLAVFSKIEPLLEDARRMLNPRFLKNLEKLIDDTPDGRKLTAETRERMAAIRAEYASKHKEHAEAVAARN